MKFKKDIIKSLHNMIRVTPKTVRRALAISSIVIVIFWLYKENERYDRLEQIESLKIENLKLEIELKKKTS